MRKLTKVIGMKLSFFKREIRLIRAFSRVALWYLRASILKILPGSEPVKIDADSFSGAIIVFCKELGTLKGPIMKMGQFLAQVSNFNPRVKKSLFELFDRSQYDISMKFEKEVEVELGKSVDELFERVMKSGHSLLVV